MGNMGLPMAGNLAKNGFIVKGFDMSDDRRAMAKDLVSAFIIYQIFQIKELCFY